MPQHYTPLWYLRNPRSQRLLPLGAAGCLSVRLSGYRAQHGGHQGLLGVGFVDARGVQLAARRVRDRHEHREVPVGWSILAEDAICLSTFDERTKAGEDVTVPGV